MKIVNTEIKIPKTETLSSEYIEKSLLNKGLDFIRWAIVDVDETNYILNVSYKTKD